MLGQLSEFLAMGQTMGQTKYTETKNPQSFAGSGFRVCRLAERVSALLCINVYKPVKFTTHRLLFNMGNCQIQTIIPYKVV